MFELRLAQFLPQTRVEGPGLRAAIWVQGCPIHCPGCAVPEYWDFHGGTSIRVEDLANKILSIPNLEGVTFAGGEPFTQLRHSPCSDGWFEQKVSPSSHSLATP